MDLVKKSFSHGFRVPLYSPFSTEVAGMDVQSSGERSSIEGEMFGGTLPQN